MSARIVAYVIAGTLTLIAIPFIAHGKQEVAQPVNCFDYYRFGSVQVNVHPQTVSTVSGVPVTFSGTILNENPYPVVDGALYVKVFRLRDNAGAKNVNGPLVVDQFLVRDGIALSGKGQLPVAFSWDIPSYAESGTYQVATFFTTSGRYNLLGLSFTDDVVGNTAQFKVLSESKGIVNFDKDNVSVNDTPFYFAAFPPRESAAGTVSVGAVVRNSTNEDAQVPVRWEVYSWDAQRPQNLIERSDQTVVVRAGGRANVSHVVRDTRHPVYLVVGTLKFQNTQSVINVRFVREGVNRPRINFPSIVAFPLRKDAPNTLFSCLHNVGEEAVESRLTLRLTDEWGSVIHDVLYEGDVAGDMQGVASPFTPDRDYDNLTLEAKLYRGEELVEEASIPYDCEKIDSALCIPSGGALADTVDSALASLMQPLVLFNFAIGGAVVGLVLVALLVRRLIRGPREPQKPTAGL